MIKWNIKKTLNLSRMQIHGHYSICSSCCKHISYKFCANSNSRLIFSVLSRKTKIWNDSYNVIR